MHETRKFGNPEIGLSKFGDLPTNKLSLKEKNRNN